MRLKPNHFRLSVFVAFLITASSLGAAIPVSALHWSGSGSFGPRSAYRGIATSFTFRLNNQATGSLDVFWVFIHFCWLASNYGYYFKENDGTPTAVSGGGSHNFTEKIPVDQNTHGNCAISIEVNGQATGDPYADSAFYPAAITVLEIPPLQVAIAANPNEGQPNLAVTFAASVTGGAAPYEYSWTFGDGGTDYIEAPIHTYTRSGTYTVTLLVNDSAGNQKTANATVTLTAPFLGGGLGASGGFLVLVGVVVTIVAAIAMLAVVILRRQKSPRPPTQPPPRL